MSRDPKLSREAIRAADVYQAAKWRLTEQGSRECARQRQQAQAERLESMLLMLKASEARTEHAKLVRAAGDRIEACALETEARHFLAAAQMWRDRWLAGSDSLAEANA